MKPRSRKPSTLTLSKLSAPVKGRDGVVTTSPVLIERASLGMSDRQLAAFRRAARKAGREMRELLNPPAP